MEVASILFERAQTVEIWGSFTRKCGSGSVATRSCHTFVDKCLHDRVADARGELAAGSAEKSSTLGASRTNAAK